MKQFRFGRFRATIDAENSVFITKLREQLFELRDEVGLFAAKNAEPFMLCDAIGYFFDSVFGSGTAKEIFNGKKSLLRGVRALKKLTRSVERDFRLLRKRGKSACKLGEAMRKSREKAS